MNEPTHPEYVPKQIARVYDDSVVYLTVKDLAKRYPELTVRSFQNILKTKPDELPCLHHRGRALIHPDDFAAWVQHRVNPTK